MTAPEPVTFITAYEMVMIRNALHNESDQLRLTASARKNGGPANAQMRADFRQAAGMYRTLATRLSIPAPGDIIEITGGAQ